MVPDARLLRRTRLTLEERELLTEPWYHDFASFGVPTPDAGSPHQKNQRAKQPVLFQFIDQAILHCREQQGRAGGVELFCADGFYTNHAVRSGASSMLGVDLDERALAKARLMAKLLGYDDRCRFEHRDVFRLEGSYDFAICAGGLYHLEDPRSLLVALRPRVKTALVVQTVFSLVHDHPSYFETPAPGWTWGCRFSYDYLMQMVRDAGWDVVVSATTLLEGNSRLEDRGSAYLLCVPRTAATEARDLVEEEREEDPEPPPCEGHEGQAPAPKLDLLNGVAVFHGDRAYTLTKHSLHPKSSQVHSHAARSLLAPFFIPASLQHRSVLDLGGDAGLFGLWALQEGAERVTYVDVDSRYVDMVRRAADHLKLANVDAHAASLAAWDEPADIVLALAPSDRAHASASVADRLDQIVEKLASLTGYILIVEWVTPEAPDPEASGDGQSAQLAAADPGADEPFAAALRAHFDRYAVLGDTCPTHRLYAAVKGTRDIQLGCPLPLLYPTSSVISGRRLATVNGLDYWSRVYLDRERRLVIKQTSLDLAEREYAFLSRLESDYFPRAKSLRVDESQSILEMELIDGTSLEESRHQVTATFEKIIEFSFHCLAVLAELSSSGIQHRDITPENILVRSGKPVLIDFGWAVSDDMPYAHPPELNPEAASVGEDKADAYGMGRVLEWVNRSKYPELDLVIGLMAQQDPALRISDPRTLARLLGTVIRRDGHGLNEGGA